MPDERSETGDIGLRIVKLENHVANGRHDRFFRDFVQFAQEFARPNHRARSIATSGEFAELLRRQFEIAEDRFADRRRNLASQGLLIAFEIAEDPLDPEPDRAAA